MTMRVYSGILIFLSVMLTFAQQTTEYIITEAPIGVKSADSLIWVKWTGTSRTGKISPDSGVIYFSKSPGGGKLINYKDSVSVFEAESLNNCYFAPSISSPVPQRGIAFRASKQQRMNPGVYYSVVAFKNKEDTLVSNEFQIIIETPNAVKIIGPTGTTNNLTPTFQWNANSGVPYYHIILSDDVVKVNKQEGEEIDINGLSIVWQAITSNTQIVYGVPDPSGTITADPPPLSPGKQYSWFVLNNYGNHMAFSSMRFDLPANFTVGGIPLNKPLCISPNKQTLNSEKDSIISFKWTNLDKRANTYKLYAYSVQSYEEIAARVIVWQTEVMAVNSAETMSVSVNAKSVFTTNDYTWRVIAIDEKGAGTASDTAGFHYDVPTGAIVIRTLEQITNNDGSGDKTILSNIGLVKMEVEVLDGSMEAPLFLYTDTDGYIRRDRPVGTYRITAVKSEFESQVQTVVVSRDATTEVTFIMSRPEATVYGKVVDVSNKGINLVTITGVSDQGDTLSTQTDALGNFVFKCYEADWFISAQKTGYKTVLPEKVTVNSGENVKFNTIKMERNPITLSGTVRNSSGSPLLGVNVRLLQDGVLIEEIPSTAQNGNFSFSIGAGSYTVIAYKTGFTTYKGTVDVVGSKSISVTLNAGASLVTGYVYGHKWVAEREIYAPVTNATVKFIGINSNDTFTCYTDATYGDYKIGLPGNQSYLIQSLATGYAVKTQACTVTTQSKTTLVYNDTIHRLASLSGNVYCSSPSNVKISLIKEHSTTVTVTGKTLPSGKYEIINIPDGKYTLNVGKDGFVFDSIPGNDTLVVINGKAVPSVMNIYLKPGSKTIKWDVTPSAFKGAVKIQSPLQKNISTNDSLRMAGAGSYVIAIDAHSDSFVDLSYHYFTVKDTAVVHTDKVTMDVYHTRKDTVYPSEGIVTLTLHSSSDLDSASVFYKDVQSSSFRRHTISQKDKSFDFNIEPPRDGITMLYYFKAYRGADIYGYEKEVYRTFIAPDTSLLTKIEIDPSNTDTLVLPSSYAFRFTLKGYYSSSYHRYSDLKDSWVSWKLDDPQGCKIEKSTGVNVTVNTGKNRAFAIPVTLTATIDTTKVKVKGDNKVSVTFRVSGSKLEALQIKRIDAGNPNPVTTSGIDIAEFSAIGIDATGANLDVTANWSIFPEKAGRISDGIFTPSSNYCGTVRVFAEASGIRSEYSIEGSNDPGLKVKYMITHSTRTDSATNQKGCTVVFPSGVVPSGEIGLLSITTEVLDNKNKRGNGIMKTVDSTAFSITESEGISFVPSGKDSVTLVLNIPENVRSGGSREIAIAYWNSDSLKWEPLPNSKVSPDFRTISVAMTHFSLYTIVLGPVNGGFLNVTPNPFSPYVWPRSISPEEKRFGTCITFQVETEVPPLRDVKLRIYTITGEPVWSMRIQNANQFPYQVWWDGRTSEKELIWTQAGNIISQTGNKMCRNGRYFVVLSAKDSNDKEQRYMKQIVLMR